MPVLNLLLHHLKVMPVLNLNPFNSEGNTNTFVTAGEDGLKFWDLRYI
jgi:hypothetical protein